MFKVPLGRLSFSPQVHGAIYDELRAVTLSFQSPEKNDAGDEFDQLGRQM